MRARLFAWLLFGASVIVFVSTNPREAVAVRIEDEAEAVYVYPAEKVAVPNIADEEQSMGFPRTVWNKIVSVDIDEIHCCSVWVFPIDASYATVRERGTPLADWINDVWHSPAGLKQAYRQTINQNGRGTTVIKYFPGGLTRNKREFLARNAYGAPSLWNVYYHIGAFQFSQRPLGNIGRFKSGGDWR